MATTIYRAGYVTTDTPANLVGGYMRVAVTAGNYQVMLSTPGAANYQVAAGKTLYITQIIYVPSSAAAFIEVGYGDNAVNNSTIPTNWRTLGPIGGLAAGTNYIIPGCWVVPAQKFVTIFANTGANPYCSFIGVEL